MIRGEDFKKHLDMLQKDEAYIDYFIDYALKNLRENPEEMKEAMESLLYFSKENNLKIGEGYSYVYTGWYHLDKLELETACKYFLEANEIFERKKWVRGTITSLNGLLSTYYKIGFFDLAIEYGLKGIKLAREYGREYSLISLSVNTALVFMDMGSLEEALTLLKKVIDSKMELDLFFKSTIYNYMAEIYIKMDKLEYAEKKVEKAYKIVSKNKYTICAPDIYYVKGLVEQKKNNCEKAELWFMESIELSKKNENVDALTRGLIYYADFLKENKEYKMAEEKLLEALNYIKKVGSISLECDVYGRLNKLGEETEDLEKAYNYLKLKNNCDKRLFNKNSSMWFAKLHTNKIEEEAISYRSLYNQIEMISNIGIKLTSGFSIKEMIVVLFEEIKKIIKVDVLNIVLYNEEDKNLKYEIYVDSIETCHNGTLSLDNENSFSVYCFKNNKDLILRNINLEGKSYVKDIILITGDKKDKDETRSLVFTPLSVEERIIGAIGIQSYDENSYTMKDLNALKLLGKYLAIAIENATLFNKVEFLATHDGLTKVLNRTEVLRIGKGGFNRLRDDKTKLSIIMLDIDYFKNVNDEYGHLVGDRVIKIICDLIEEEGTKKILGRYGGEEFLLIYEGISKNEVILSGERIRKKIENNIFTNEEGNSFNVTLSLGVYEFSGKEKNFFEGVMYADRALYKAKEYGRNSLEVCNS